MVQLYLFVLSVGGVVRIEMTDYLRKLGTEKSVGRYTRVKRQLVRKKMTDYTTGGLAGPKKPKQKSM